MATIYAYYETGKTVRAVIRNDSGQYADVVAEAMESYDAADLDDYGVTATETGATGEYAVTWPSWLATGLYTVQWLPLAGANIVVTDFPNRFAIDSYYWDGTNIRPALAVHTAAILATVNHVDHGNAAILARGNAAWVTATGFSTLTTMDVDNRLATWGKTGFALDAAAGWGGAALPTQFEASNMRGTDDAALEATLTAMKGEGWTNETLKAIAEAVEASNLLGPGGVATTITVHDALGNPIDGVAVWITSDAAGTDTIAGTLHTNASGQVTFMLDHDAGPWYAWRQKSGYDDFTNPLTMTWNAGDSRYEFT